MLTLRRSGRRLFAQLLKCCRRGLAVDDIELMHGEWLWWRRSRRRSDHVAVSSVSRDAMVKNSSSLHVSRARVQLARLVVSLLVNPVVCSDPVARSICMLTPRAKRELPSLLREVPKNHVMGVWGTEVPQWGPGAEPR